MDHEEDASTLNGHALPSHSPGAAAASWNPAFRPNTDADEDDDDFFQRYPGPTPKKDASVVVVADPVMYEEEDDEALLRDQEIPILSPDETAAEQEEALEALMPGEGLTGAENGEEMDPESARWGDDVDENPADNYDFQGEISAMDEALERRDDTPLLPNEEPLPTSQLLSRDAPMLEMSSREDTPDFEVESASSLPHSKPTHAPPALERAFTTNFSDSPIEPTSSQARAIPDEWPSVGDDVIFGELLDKREEQPTFAEKKVLEATAAKESTTMASPDLDLLPSRNEPTGEVDLAAAWGAALDDDDMLEETPTDLDPSQFFGGDDDGFLLDDEPPVPPQTQPLQSQTNAPATQYRPANLQPVPPQQAAQTIPSPQFFNQTSHGRAADTPPTGLYEFQNQYPTHQAQPPQRPNPLQQHGHAQSFADKSKGGYQSPYDLPMEVVKTRRRPQQASQHLATPTPPPGAPPPPRTSSFGSPLEGEPPLSQLNAPPVQPPATSSFPPTDSRARAGSAGSTAPPAPAAKKSHKRTASSFFEELPITTKPRARPAMAYGSQTLPNVPTVGANARGPMSPPQAQSSPYQPQRGPIGAPQQTSRPAQPAFQFPGPNADPGSFASSTTEQMAMYGGLRQPERMPLLPDNPSQQPQKPQPQPAQHAPPVNMRYSPTSQQQQSNASASMPPPQLPAQARYSPAPTAVPGTSSQPPPAAATRYSPAPTQQKVRQPSAPVSMQQGNPFAPRTSSPLAAYTDKPQPALPAEATRGFTPTSPPKVNGIQRSPEANITSKYIGAEARGLDPAAQQQFGPPLPRAGTQSPDATLKVARTAQVPPAAVMGVGVQPPKGRPVLPHRRQFSRELIFAAPPDERSQDPLQRWKGHPIFNWSAGGTILSSFPKHTPFYAAGLGAPSVKCTPGAISIQDAGQFFPMDERTAKFPGPLVARSKGRKKDVLAWMAGKVEDLERAAESAGMDPALPVDVRKRADEKLVLWRILRIWIENDGVLEGNPKVEEEVRRVLLPNLADMAQVSELQSPTGATLQRDAVDKSVTLQIRQALLEGQRERAVWLAEEKRLWGHAMLIASTMGPETWKQIVQAFVRNQVKSFGSDARSLAALYHVFAGNSDECVDELVPPSARAGFQMINMTDGSIAGNPLEGLDQWRETLDLVMSNRTPNEAPSLIALGKLLAGYGRVEAAHTCYLFAKALVKHSGADDPEAHFVLLGANHQAPDESFGSDLDSILLTEIYEYGTSLSAPSTAGSYIPHLQAYKLVHAQELAARGLKTKAQSYCDAITTAYTSTTKPSPYYHPVFTQAVADLNAFLSQTPQDGKNKLFSRPAMNKVSSSASNWFTKFVSGDDDQASTDSGPGGANSEGPFGGVSGDSGSISRSASGTDLYNPTIGGVPTPGPSTSSSQIFASSTSAPSRYAPGNQNQSPGKYGVAQQYSGSGMPASEPQRAVSARYAPPPPAAQGLGVPAAGLARKVSDHSLPYAPSSRRGSAYDTSSQGSYEPRPTLADEASASSYSPVIHSPPTHSPAVSSPLVLAQQPAAVQEPPDVLGAAAVGLSEPLNGDEQDESEGVVDDDGAGSGYIPPTGGYEPPEYSYQPYEPEPDSPEAAKPKRRMFGDEDEDEGAAQLQSSAAALKKAQADREADDLVRKAAEADAARDKDKAAQKKGWFGWFGSGSREASASPGPIKAKLGEENSFYYDENLKKWVNKKAGAGESAASAAPTPPPPRGPASRVASSSMGPPSGPPSRTSSGSGLANLNMTNNNRPPTSGSGAMPTSGASSGPPSRSGTPFSNAPSESGAAAPPTSVPTLNGSALNLPAVVAASAAGRPSSSLSNASSIDDLLASGPPGGSRKAGGTVKKKKGRYVDVMAQ